MSERVRYSRQYIVSSFYYQLPKFLFDDEFRDLSNDARVLYALLRNRHEISIKNEWVDESGDVYLCYKREDMQDILGLSENTVRKAVNELKKHNLMEEERQGLSKPNKIYLLFAINVLPVNETAEKPMNSQTLKNCGSRTSKSAGQEPQNLPVKSRNNCGSGASESAGLDTQVLRSSYYNNINKDFNNKPANDNLVKSSLSGITGSQDKAKSHILNISLSDYPLLSDDKDHVSIESVIESYTLMIKENISYSYLAVKEPYRMKLVDEIITIIIDTLLTKDETVRIGGECKPRSLVINALTKLNCDNILLVIDQFRNVSDRISKKKQYILTMLYNSTLEEDSHYTNLVAHNRR